MKVVLVFCVILVLTNGTTINTKIVGGWDAQPGQFKYIASLRISYIDHHLCGATIITPRTLVTAAHCNIQDITNMVAVVGTVRLDDRSGKRIHVKEFIVHPEYNSDDHTSDVAVVILAKDIEFDANVQPIKLPNRRVQENESLTSAGWGYTSYPGAVSRKLQWLKQNVVGEEMCKHIAPLETIWGKICALESAGHGLCSFDSGGPLVNSNEELVGISSSMIKCATGIPDFFTDVLFFMDWIETKIQ